MSELSVGIRPMLGWELRLIRIDVIRMSTRQLALQIFLRWGFPMMDPLVPVFTVGVTLSIRALAAVIQRWIDARRDRRSRLREQPRYLLDGRRSGTSRTRRLGFEDTRKL